MFDRLKDLLGEDVLNKIKDKHILLIGLGGVGGSVLEALVRSGVGHICIVDGDVIDISNLNRQIISNMNNIGKFKVDEAILRAKAINPDIDIKGIKAFVGSNNIDKIIDYQYDYIIDACDDTKAKIDILRYAKEHNIKIIMALGTGKRLNPEYVKISRLDKTKNDPLAKKMRELARKNNIDMKIPVVYSEEESISTNKTKISSSIFVPQSAGILIAYYIIKEFSD